MSDRTILESLANQPTRRHAIVGVAMAFGGLALGSAEARVGAEDEISRTAEAIHQEPVFKASRKRVYEALTDTKQFDSVIQISGVMKSMPPGGKPTEIGGEVGGRSCCSAGISLDGMSNSYPTNESYKRGEPAAGIRASTRSRDSSLRSRAPEPKLFLTILVFPRAGRSTWQQDGKSIIGSRLRPYSLRSPLTVPENRPHSVTARPPSVAPTESTPPPKPTPVRSRPTRWAP